LQNVPAWLTKIWQANQNQAQKFTDLTRELGCDDDEEAFDERLRRIAKAPKPNDEPD
jgi:hypothetical protein